MVLEFYSRVFGPGMKAEMIFSLGYKSWNKTCARSLGRETCGKYSMKLSLRTQVKSYLEGLIKARNGLTIFDVLP